MPKVRVLSWNVRTLASHVPSQAAMTGLVAVIRASRADIVCIQELMPGVGTGAAIGSPISHASEAVIDDLRQRLHALDGGANWTMAVSGVNAQLRGNRKAIGLRDAYAFLFKTTPLGSNMAINDPVPAVELVLDPTIVTDLGRASNRQPGVATFTVLAGGTRATCNVVSCHAQTPTNMIAPEVAENDVGNDYPGAGWAVNRLPRSRVIGGGSYGYPWTWPLQWNPAVRALPSTDTLVLGDFNYSMTVRGDLGHPGGDTVYRGLGEGYDGCVSVLGAAVRTTYSPTDYRTDRTVMAYDNIFSRKSGGGLVQPLTKAAGASSGALDFIGTVTTNQQALVGFAVTRQNVWIAVHQALYKGQWGQDGLSDHLPVWTDFDVAPCNGAGGQWPRPTRSTASNGFFHATQGALANGWYLDAAAAGHRTDLVGRLDVIRNTGFTSAVTKAAVLTAMLAQATTGTARQQLNQLLANPMHNPFTSWDEFLGEIDAYITAIEAGRKLELEDALVAARLFDTKLKVWTSSGVQYQQAVLNSTSANDLWAPVFFQGTDFVRWM